MAPQQVGEGDCGLKILANHAVDDAAGAVDVVAIHGMGAHPVKTWQTMRDAQADPRRAESWDNPVNWLIEKDMLPAVLPRARIMAYGYQSNWFGEEKLDTRPTIISRGLLDDLVDERQHCPLRPLIFVAHSFGGLVLLQTLVDANREADKWGDIFRSTAGLIFFGTPFRGADGSLSQAQILQLAEEHIAENANVTNLRIMQGGDGSLTNLLDDYLSIGRQIKMPRIACFFEQKESDIGAVVGQKNRMKRVLVSEGSGTLDTNEWTEKYARACDHFSINKYRDANSADFKTLARVMRKMESGASGLVASRALPPAEEREIQDMKKRLMLTNPDIDRNNLIDEKHDRTPGTCEWILKNQDFGSWLRGGDGISQLLWISGGPAKGKTFISLFLTDALKKEMKPLDNRPVNVFYFFCVNKDDRRNTAIAIIRGLLWQLTTAERPWVASYLKRQLADSENAALVLDSRETLWQLFAEIMLDPRAGHMAFVVDGLDECKGDSADWISTKIMDHFSTARARGKVSSGIRFVIVSRPSVRLPQGRIRLDLDSQLNAEVQADIRCCVTSSVTTLAGLDGFDSEFRDRLEATMMERAEGTFLWVGLAMDELGNKETLSEVEQITSLLPAGLDAAYGRMLLQIKPEHRQASARMLRHLAVAQRPLTLPDFLGLLAEPGDYQSNLDQYVRDHIKHCGPIVAIIQDEVHFVHMSARDFMLQREPSDDAILKIFRQGSEQAHLELARACLRSTRLFHDGGSHLHRLHCTFYDYALANWPHHAGKISAQAGRTLLEEEREFFQNTRLLDTWWKAYIQTRTAIGATWQERLEQVPELHCAAFTGFVPWLEKILETISQRKGLKKWTSRNRVDEAPNDISALMCAAVGDQAAAAETLVTHGADPNGLGILSYARPPLLLAAERGYNDVVKVFIKHNVRLVTRTHKVLSLNERAIHAAAKRGQAETVQILLDAGADLNDFDTARRTPLHVTAPSLVHYLVEAGAWLNHKDDKGSTPLHMAVTRESHEGTMALLNEGADIECRNHDGDSALHLAIDTTSEDIVNLLLDQGADLEAINGLGNTPLLHAVETRLRYRPNLEMVKLLLNRGANVRAHNNAGQTAFQIANEQAELGTIATCLLHHFQNGRTPAASQAAGSSPSRPFWSYEAAFDVRANPKDPRSLSLKRKELCTSLDPTGEWWLVRRADGRFGMAQPDWFRSVPNPDGSQPRQPKDYFREMSQKFNLNSKGVAKLGGKLGAKLSMLEGSTWGRESQAGRAPLETRAAAIRTKLGEVRARESFDGTYGTAQHDYRGEEDYYLNIIAGERVLGIEELDDFWGIGRNDKGEIGIYPRAYVVED